MTVSITPLMSHQRRVIEIKPCYVECERDLVATHFHVTVEARVKRYECVGESVNTGDMGRYIKPMDITGRTSRLQTYIDLHDQKK